MANMQESFNAGQARGSSEEKTNQLTQNVADKAQTAADKAHSAADRTADNAQHAKEDPSGFLQQTGESVKNMAQGAVDGVKNTLGINDQKK